jgi:hypothetical protein
LGGSRVLDGRVEEDRFGNELKPVFFGRVRGHGLIFEHEETFGQTFGRVLVGSLFEVLNLVESVLGVVDSIVLLSILSLIQCFLTLISLFIIRKLKIFLQLIIRVMGIGKRGLHLPGWGLICEGQRSS